MVFRRRRYGRGRRRKGTYRRPFYRRRFKARRRRFIKRRRGMRRRASVVIWRRFAAGQTALTFGHQWTISAVSGTTFVSNFAGVADINDLYKTWNRFKILKCVARFRAGATRQGGVYGPLQVDNPEVPGAVNLNKTPSWPVWGGYVNPVGMRTITNWPDLEKEPSSKARRIIPGSSWSVSWRPSYQGRVFKNVAGDSFREERTTLDIENYNTPWYGYTWDYDWVNTTAITYTDMPLQWTAWMKVRLSGFDRGKLLERY